MQRWDNNENSSGANSTRQTFPPQPAEERGSRKMWKQKMAAAPCPPFARSMWVGCPLPSDKSSGRTKISGACTREACLLGPLTLPQPVLLAGNKAEVTNSAAPSRGLSRNFLDQDWGPEGGRLQSQGYSSTKMPTLKTLNSWRALWRAGS